MIDLISTSSGLILRLIHEIVDIHPLKIATGSAYQ